MSHPILRGLPAVTYSRASSDRQEASIPDQQAELKLFNDRLACDVLAQFDDFDKPGSLESRPGSDAMLAFVRRRPKAAPVRVILTTNADRFSRRDMMDTMAALKQFRDAGIRWMATPAKVYDL